MITDPKQKAMALRGLARGCLIGLAMILAPDSYSVRQAVAQTREATPKAEAPKRSINTSIDQLSGTLAPDIIKELASHWDGTKLAVPLQLSVCESCADAATRKALAAAAGLGSLRDIKKSANGSYRISGPDGGQLYLSNDGQIEVSPATIVKFTRTLCYVVDFEHGQAKITVAVHGTHETREIAFVHIRPVAPASFEPITLGKHEPWIWGRALTW